jgi:hypothetical protein
MPQIVGLDKVLGALQKKATEAKAMNLRVDVGYSASYSTLIHEDLERQHPHGGSAKFLETPAREMESELAAIVQNALKEGKTMEEALMLSGQALLVASQALVPVQTGNLLRSGYVRVEEV